MWSIMLLGAVSFLLALASTPLIRIWSERAGLVDPIYSGLTPWANDVDMLLWLAAGTEMLGQLRAHVAGVADLEIASGTAGFSMVIAVAGTSRSEGSRHRPAPCRRKPRVQRSACHRRSQPATTHRPASGCLYRRRRRPALRGPGWWPAQRRPAARGHAPVSSEWRRTVRGGNRPASHRRIPAQRECHSCLLQWR